MDGGIMIEVKSIIQKVLLDKKYPSSAKIELKKLLNNCKNEDYIYISTGIRICNNYINIKMNRGTWEDFGSNLRQFKLYTKDTIFISNKIKNSLEKIKGKLLIDILEYDGKNEFIVINKYPSWLISNKFKEVYSKKIYRNNRGVIGDPKLYNMTGYNSYKSSIQKQLMDVAINMPEGSTLLGCMATGEGKSLIGLLPQFYESNGMTIIIVPTVALAIDQRNSAYNFYEKERVCSYYGSLDIDEKREIRNKVLNNDIDILFISPEALLNNSFKKIINDVAKKGFINRLVIDEAHIIEEWGKQFRIEFQLLSVFRRIINEISPRKIKTILLSATYTETSIKLLKKLFSEDNNFIEVRGDKLRPEIIYHYNECASRSEKLGHLKEIIYLLPRPIIIYTIRPETAEEIKKELNNINLLSVDTFTGKITDGLKREKLISKWIDNDIDIMVATSAFGMGVDKKDVRTVLHYSIPESINRFYQEVGRGGRDGLASISLFITNTYSDLLESKYFINEKIISIDKFVARWEKMYTKKEKDEKSGYYWIDSKLKPDYLDDEHIVGNQNTSWNESVILTLYKENIIDIKDFILNESYRKYLIDIRQKDLIIDKDEFLRTLKKLRKRDALYAKESEEEITNFIKKDINTKCMGNILSDVYNEVSSLCNGCHYCIKEKNMRYENRHNKSIFKEGLELIIKSKEKNISDFTSNNYNLFLYYYSENENIPRIVSKILENGVYNIISKREILMNLIHEKYNVEVSFIEASEILNNNYVLTGASLIIFTNNPIYNEKLYEIYLKIKERSRIIILYKLEHRFDNNEKITDRIIGKNKYIK